MYSMYGVYILMNRLDREHGNGEKIVESFIPRCNESIPAGRTIKRKDRELVGHSTQGAGAAFTRP